MYSNDFKPIWLTKNVRQSKIVLSVYVVNIYTTFILQNTVVYINKVYYFVLVLMEKSNGS